MFNIFQNLIEQHLGFLQMCMSRQEYKNLNDNELFWIFGMCFSDYIMIVIAGFILVSQMIQKMQELRVFRHKQLSVENETKINNFQILVAFILTMQIFVNIFSQSLNKFEILHSGIKLVMLALCMILIRIQFFTIGKIEIISKIVICLIAYTNFNEIMDIWQIKMRNIKMDNASIITNFSFIIFLISLIKFSLSIGMVQQVSDDQFDNFNFHYEFYERWMQFDENLEIFNNKNKLLMNNSQEGKQNLYFDINPEMESLVKEKQNSLKSQDKTDKRHTQIKKKFVDKLAYLSSRRKVIMYLLFITNLISNSYISTQAYLSIQIKMSTVTYGYLQGIPQIVLMYTLKQAETLVKEQSRFEILVQGLLIMEVTCLGTLFATNFITMLVVRCFSNLSWSMIFISINSYIFKVKVEENDENITQVAFALQNIGSVVGMIICNNLCNLIGFQNLYYILLFLSMISIAVLFMNFDSVGQEDFNQNPTTTKEEDKQVKKLGIPMTWNVFVTIFGQLFCYTNLMQHEAQTILYMTQKQGSYLFTVGIVIVTIGLLMTGAITRYLHKYLSIKTASSIMIFINGFICFQISIFFGYPQIEMAIILICLVVSMFQPINSLSNDMIDSSVEYYHLENGYSEEEVKFRLDQENFAYWDQTLRQLPAIMGNIIWGQVYNSLGWMGCMKILGYYATITGMMYLIYVSQKSGNKQDSKPDDRKL